MLDFLIQFVAILALWLAVIGAGGIGFSGIAIAIFSIVSFLLIFGYDVAFEVLNNGRTPGKSAAGIRVVNLDGDPIGFVTSSVRNLLRIADFLPIFYLVGSVSIVATTRDQRLGDLAAGTVVIRERFDGQRQAGYIAPVTVPVEQIATWDVTAIDADDLRVVRHFLERRLAMPWPVRTYFGIELAKRMWPKLVGVPNEIHQEFLLEGIVVAKQSRA
jgi:uncharacterized RDD family membrane protein YckC